MTPGTPSKGLVLTDLFYGPPDWKKAARGMRMVVQPLDRPYMHITLGCRLHTVMVNEEITVSLDDGHFWDLKVREVGSRHRGPAGFERLKVDLEHRHSENCPCHSTNARGSLDFAVQAARKRRYLHK